MTDDGGAAPLPVPAGRRITWSDLPAHVRGAVEEILGDRVTQATSQASGFSPGTADRVATASGGRAFVKAVGAALSPQSPGIHRREAAVHARLPASPHLPRFLGSFDDGDWVALVLEDVPGRHPATPWDGTELDAVLAALSSLSRTLTPSPVADVKPVRADLGRELAGWERIREDTPASLDTWAADRLDLLVAVARAGVDALEGESLLHTDVRSDYLLVREDGTVTVVDWPWA